MKKIFLTVGAVAFLFLAGSGAEAVTAYNGTVNLEQTDWNYSRFIIGLNGTPGPCSGQQFSIDGSNPNYKESVALIMGAFSMGKTVSLSADGTCPNNRANVIGVTVQ